MTRPEFLKGTTHKIKTGCGNMYITMNYDDSDSLVEIFAQLGKTGGCAASQSEAIGRLITIALEFKVPKERLAAQLRGIRCNNPVLAGNETLSCADAIGRVLDKDY